MQFVKHFKYWEVPTDLLEGLEYFLCLLYGQNYTHDVNVARYNIFRLKGSSDDGLPPNKLGLSQTICYTSCIPMCYKPWMGTTKSGPGISVEDRVPCSSRSTRKCQLLLQKKMLC